jgi:hypothetical protein
MYIKTHITGLAYNDLILTAKDFTALADILSRANIVDTKYLEKPDGGYETYCVVLDKAQLEGTTKIPERLYSQGDFDRMKEELAAAKTEKEMKNV